MVRSYRKIKKVAARTPGLKIGHVRDPHYIRSHYPAWYSMYPKRKKRTGKLLCRAVKRAMLRVFIAKRMLWRLLTIFGMESFSVRCVVR